MCYDLLNEKVILHQALLSVCLVDVYSIYLSFGCMLNRVVSVRRFF